MITKCKVEIFQKNFLRFTKMVDTMSYFLVEEEPVRCVGGVFESPDESGARDVQFLDLNLFILLTAWRYCDTFGCYKRQRKAQHGVKSHVHLST